MLYTCELYLLASAGLRLLPISDIPAMHLAHLSSAFTVKHSHFPVRMDFPVLQVPPYPYEKRLDLLFRPTQNSHEQAECEALQPIQHVDQVPFANLFQLFVSRPGVDGPFECLGTRCVSMATQISRIL